MRWHSFAELVVMGGAGFYVWTAFGVTALCLLWEVLALRRRSAAASAGFPPDGRGDEGSSQ